MYIEYDQNGRFNFTEAETDIRMDAPAYERYRSELDKAVVFNVGIYSPGTPLVITEENYQEYIVDLDPGTIVPPPKQLTDIEQTQLAVAEAIEKQEADKIEQQLAQAEMFETILQMLEPQGGGE